LTLDEPAKVTRRRKKERKKEKKREMKKKKREREKHVHILASPRNTSRYLTGIFSKEESDVGEFITRVHRTNRTWIINENT